MFGMYTAVACCPKPADKHIGSEDVVNRYVGSADVPFCDEPPPEICTWVQCGSNSPTINSFPINGLRPDGECNFEGVQLLPGSMLGGENGACDGATLEVRYNELIGLRPNGTFCKGEQLKGATFVVRSWVPNDRSGRKTLTVHIDDVTTYAPKSHAARAAYRMTTDDGESLCKSKASSAARNKLGIPILTGLTDPPAGKDLVIPVWSELYDRVGKFQKVELRWKRRESAWLSLACVDDALAKRSLYGLYTDEFETSRAALLMLAANYCGNLDATMRGVEINWEAFDDDDPTPASVDPKMLEAEWSSSGAVCLSKPRILYTDGATPHLGILRGDISKACPGCAADAVIQAIRECKAVGERPAPAGSTPHASLPTCEGCTGPKCKGRHLRSYVRAGSGGSQ